MGRVKIKMTLAKLWLLFMRASATPQPAVKLIIITANSITGSVLGVDRKACTPWKKSRVATASTYGLTEILDCGGDSDESEGFQHSQYRCGENTTALILFMMIRIESGQFKQELVLTLSLWAGLVRSCQFRLLRLDFAQCYRLK